MNTILAKLRKYEIRIKKAVNSQMYGNFRSLFKGSGLEFADLRPYQFGDDIRLIDWSSTAKGHGTFVKIFREEKEQTVFFVIDVSASQDIGNRSCSKLDTTKEICGVLALSAIQEASHVGLLCFSDQKELYIKPANSIKNGYRIILDIFKLKPKSAKTNLTEAILFTQGILHRKSIVIFISDFIDVGYERHLKALARKHDLVAVHLYDKREIDLPSLGIVPVYDTENKQTQWVNTSSASFRHQFRETFYKNKNQLEKLCKQHNANYIAIASDEDYVPRLVELFSFRQKQSLSLRFPKS